MPISGRPVATYSLQCFAEPDHQVERHHAPGAERVAVREAAGDADQAGLGERLGIGGELGGEHDHRVGTGELEGERQVAVAVGAGPGDDERRRSGSCHRLRERSGG